MAIHVVGGGVAGLSAAISCVRYGHRVILYEAAPELGGRARTYFSSALDTQIDNGAHAVLRNNQAVHDYLVLCGSQHELAPHGIGGLRFYDVRNHLTSRFAVPGVLWTAAARPPGVSLGDLAGGLKLFSSNPHRTAADVLRARPHAVERLWSPLCSAALNTPLEDASAAALATVVRQMARPGGLHEGLHLPAHSLSATYIEPAAQWLRERATIERGTPLRALEIEGGLLKSLLFDRRVTLDDHDAVILALPPWSPLLRVAGIDTSPFTYAPILNVHFRLDSVASSQFTGLIGGAGQWLWVRHNMASVTISAADAFQNVDADEIASLLWSEIALLLCQNPSVMPRAHVIKERRATLRHTPALNRHRPGISTRYTNLYLAGDWVVADSQRPLPCTLESAIQSGFTAAKRAADGAKRV